MGLRVGERKMQKRGSGKRAKEDMTTPVKDISCHGTLLLSSLPALLLQSYSALFRDHCLSFNLFRVLMLALSSLVLFPPVLLQLIIESCPRSCFLLLAPVFGVSQHLFPF